MSSGKTLSRKALHHRIIKDFLKFAKLMFARRCWLNLNPRFNSLWILKVEPFIVILPSKELLFLGIYLFFVKELSFNCVCINSPCVGQHDVFVHMLQLNKSKFIYDAGQVFV